MNVRGPKINFFKATAWLTLFNGLPRWDGSKCYVNQGGVDIVVGPNANVQDGHLILGTFTGDGTSGRVITPGVVVGGRLEYILVGPRTNFTSSTHVYVTRTFPSPRAHVLHSTGASFASITSFTATTFTVDAVDGIVNYLGGAFHYVVFYTIP